MHLFTNGEVKIARYKKTTKKLSIATLLAFGSANRMQKDQLP